MKCFYCGDTGKVFDGTKCACQDPDQDMKCGACFDTGCCCGGVGISCHGGCCSCDTALRIRGEKNEEGE